MKTKFTFSRIILFALFSLCWSAASADTFYLCPGATISLNPAATPNITYSWDVKDVDGITSLSGYPRAGAPTNLPSVAGTYKVLLISTPANANICAPDVVEHSFTVLPTLSMTLSAPTNVSYCETSANNSSQITQSTSTVPTGATADLEIEYSYMVAKDGGTAVNGTTAGLGSIDATGKYTLSTTTPGVYVITGTVKYKQKTGFTNALLTASGCPATSSTQTITVTAKPAKPTITISAN